MKREQFSVLKNKPKFCKNLIKQFDSRHAKREAEIQKSIKHAKIIRLYDIFDVDINT